MTQINKGEEILNELYNIFLAGKMSSSKHRVDELSNSFLTAIPHNIGRARESVASAVIDSMEAFAEKQELLQLMRDMLNVTIGTFWVPPGSSSFPPLSFRPSFTSCLLLF
jgi:hypothetical protein